MADTQYGSLAYVYDKLLRGDIDYGAWADRIEAAFDEYLPQRPEIVLDLACGTGNMALELASRGYDMIGVDLSQEMLSEAYQKAADKNVRNVLFLNQDMRDFELYGTVGAIVCCLDGVNYLTGRGDIDACFSCTHNYLDPGGLFIFDVNTPYKFENVYGNNSYILEDDGVYCGWQNDYNKKSGVCDFYLTIFEKSGKSGAYTRSDEVQRERCYTLAMLTSALGKSGFELVAVCDGLLGGTVAPQSEKWSLIAKAVKG
jgi:Methylase involved in ubiquinone/menaquinone biosynthesis